MNGLLDKAASNPKRIVFPESTDDRILGAIKQILERNIAIPVLVGSPDEIQHRKNELGLEFDCEIVDPANDEIRNRYAQEFFKLRSHKGVSEQQAQDIMQKPMYFATMMVQLEEADGLVAGATTTTADTIKPAMQIIKTDSSYHKVSGYFLMIFEDKVHFYADCAVQVNAEPIDLAKIAIDTALTAKKFDVEPRVAMLSFSTKGSAQDPALDRIKLATYLANELHPELIIEGELQVDAACVPEVAAKKFPNSKLQGQANVLIFPDLNSGNIAYKLVQRFAGALAVGPIIQGLNKPVNDLSRGCSAEDVVEVTAITGIQAQ